MNIMVVDEDRMTVLSVVDAFESFIWTDRYNRYGDFELYTLASKENIDLFRKNRYLIFDESDHAMIIEKIKITTNADNGNHMTVSGRSLESILDRRVIWKQTLINSTVSYAVNKLLQENIISPTDSFRRLDYYHHAVHGMGGDDVPDVRIKAQFTGDSLYDAVRSICESVDAGFRMWINLDAGSFWSTMYKGKDRTNAQSENPLVIFSPGFESLIDSNYLYDSSNYKNAALVLGEGEGRDRARQSIGDMVTGLERRELYVDARDLSTNNGEITQEEYEEQLVQRGIEKLSDNLEESDFDGSIDVEGSFKPNEDFFLGDIVHLENEYGMNQNCRVIEMIHSIDAKGYSVYPSFEAVFNYTLFVPTNANYFETADEKLLAVVR